MNFQIRAYPFDLTEALSKYVRARFERVERHNNYIVSVEVALSRHEPKANLICHKAAVTVRVKGVPIYVNHSDEDLYRAIDTVMLKLDRKLQDHKDRFKKPCRKSAKRGETTDYSVVSA